MVFNITKKSYANITISLQFCRNQKIHYKESLSQAVPCLLNYQYIPTLTSLFLSPIIFTVNAEPGTGIIQMKKAMQK